VGEEAIDIYRTELSRVAILIDNDNIDKVDHGSVCPWSNFVEMRSQYTEDSNEYLILCLYTMIPCMRDDFGRVFLVRPSKDEPENELNLYFMESGRLLISQYKTAKTFGTIDIILPLKLQWVIDRSIWLEPRPYLLTQSNNPTKIYCHGNGGKLSLFIKKNLGFNINDLRHSLETYLEINRMKFTYAELKLIRFIMGHDSSTADDYSRRASEPSIDWTEADVSQTADPLESIFIKLGGNQ